MRILPYGGVVFVFSGGDGQNDAKTVHHKALKAMNFRPKQDGALSRDPVVQPPNGNPWDIDSDHANGTTLVR